MDDDLADLIDSPAIDHYIVGELEEPYLVESYHLLM